VKENSTFIAVVLDRSGSMAGIAVATIAGFNKFLAEQKALPGEALLTLAQFDDVYEVVHEAKPLQEVPELTAETFQPRGSTALLDAIGRTINSVGIRLAALPEPERPARVLMLIVTDGHENKSTEFRRQQIQEMVKHQREKYSWEFVYIGANQDALQVATAMNIAPQNAMNYDASAMGTRDAWVGASSSLRSYRGGGSASVSGNTGSKS